MVYFFDVIKSFCIYFTKKEKTTLLLLVSNSSLTLIILYSPLVVIEVGLGPLFMCVRHFVRCWCSVYSYRSPEKQDWFCKKLTFKYNFLYIIYLFLERCHNSCRWKSWSMLLAPFSIQRLKKVKGFTSQCRYRKLSFLSHSIIVYVTHTFFCGICR